MKKPDNVIRDPMCGMSMNIDFAIRVERDGKTYYFCSEACRDRFLREGPKK